MHGCALSLAPINFLSISHLCSAYPQTRFPYLRLQSSPFVHPQPLFSIRYRNPHKRRRFISLAVKAKQRESPYEVLGVSPSATPDEIKKAYRRMALKFHPDVNKEANAQEKFMRIKHAYNTLLNSESRRRYESGSGTSDYSYWTGGRNKSQEEEQFYGFEDFFKDLQEEFKSWEASAASQGKPKSLWEELAEIGEEFVEFLEKELNINDEETTPKEDEKTAFQTKGTDRSRSGSQSEASNRSSVEDNIDDIEATLAELKKQLGL